MRNALYCLAEATRGLTPELRWSIDSGILRREYRPLFDRVYEHTLDEGPALEIFVQSRAVKMAHVRTVVEDRYNLFIVHLTNEEQAELTCLREFEQAMSLFDPFSLYAAPDSVMRAELYPLFHLCHDHKLGVTDTLDAVIDNVQAKRTYYLDMLAAIVHNLTKELVATGVLRRVLEREDRATNGHDNKTGEGH